MADQLWAAPKGEGGVEGTSAERKYWSVDSTIRMGKGAVMSTKLGCDQEKGLRSQGEKTG